MPERHTVSCEPCKRKKCKCDRKLPCCSQCSTLPSFCKYHENNKRGIPTGYLNALEQRLNDTEDALFNALAELRELRSRHGYNEHSQTPVSISSRPANETKGSRMEEWKRFPMKELRDLDTWWVGVLDGHGRTKDCKEDIPLETSSSTTQGTPLSTGLVKSTQLVREMHHVYY